MHRTQEALPQDGRRHTCRRTSCRRHLQALRPALLLLLFIPSVTLAEPCTPAEQIVTQKTANAGVLANLRNAAGSLRYESAQLLAQAERDDFPPLHCAAGCEPSGEAELLLTSVPQKFRTNYRDAAQCEALLSKTRAEPFRYSGRRFATIEALNTWFGEFSQGEGKDGEDLYTRCGGDCSPQYSTAIRKHSDGYLVDAEVVCGHARDKEDNQYALTLLRRRPCALPAELKN